ncbi:hypothetical protein L1987_44968 [Smallanthus sonchifolius]|uniref:Uncharacterized protein n=1 Tax=Smallanthus sonchifolius TaxID=185202 RepID=A0ACB9GQX4_9ASTR|nr:hypothetical protein L1987_44968 [Smallanthus sonchifolius]
MTFTHKACYCLNDKICAKCLKKQKGKRQKMAILHGGGPKGKDGFKGGGSDEEEAKSSKTNSNPMQHICRKDGFKGGGSDEEDGFK